jgi:transcriptional regulator with XRE-family HTH domain
MSKDIENKGDKPINTDIQSSENLLAKQGSGLSRLIKHSNMTVVEIAKHVGVDRQTIYLWQKGKALMPEDKLLILSKLFGREPAEIRYDISLFNPEDMKTVIRVIETELERRNIDYIKPERRAALITSLYALYQSHKRRLHESYLDSDFEMSVKESVDVFTA